MSAECQMQDTMERLEHVLTRLSWHQRRLCPKELVPYGLTLPQFIVLDQIARHHTGDRTNMGEIADMAQQCAPRITGIVSHLARTGLVTRTRAPSDQRQVLVGLTEEGQRVRQQLTSARHKALKRRLERFGRENTSDILRLVDRCLQIVESVLAEGSDQSNQPDSPER